MRGGPTSGDLRDLQVDLNHLASNHALYVASQNTCVSFLYWYKVKWLYFTGVRRHSSGNDSVHTHRQGKALSNTFNTYNTFKAPRWTNRTGNGPTLIFSRTRKVLVYSTPSVAIISVWTQILEKSHSSRYVLAFCPHIAKKNSQIHNSQRLTNVKLHLNPHHNIHNIHDIHNIQSIHLCISRRLIERHKTELMLW